MKVIRRDDVDFELTFTDVDGDVVNLTGATVFFTVKKRITDIDDDAVIAKEITVFDFPLTGVAILTLDETDTDISPGQYYYDIQLKTSNAKITSSNYGKFYVAQDITIRTS